MVLGFGWRPTGRQNAFAKHFFHRRRGLFNLSGTGCEPPPSEWDRLESRIEQNLRGLFELLAAGGGDHSRLFRRRLFRQKVPHLIREAVAVGHEIASHSYFHRLVYQMSASEFYEDALATRKLLEEPAVQYAAFALRPSRSPPWFFEKLVEAGYSYDSSVFPACHQTGGLATAHLEPHGVQTLSGTITEFPITAVRVLGRPMCFFGGGYLRLFP